MIAIAMLYAILVTALAGGAALALERAVRMLGRPARFVWLAAIVLATSFVAERMVTSTRPVPPAAVAAASPTPASTAPAAAEATPANPTQAPWWNVTIRVPVSVRALNEPLLGAWLAGSLLWGAILIGSATRLRRRRDGWRAEMLDGTPVYLSHDVGPALFGLMRYSIVIPSWVRDLDPEQRRLILAHEREHARASDPMTLLAGALLLLVQPWNPAAWLIFRRLRFAVEADCDARVIRRSRDVRSYGELLLDLGERTLAGVAPVAAISEPSTNLERRITLLTPVARPRPLLRSLALALAGGLLVFVACQVPRPVRGADPRANLTAPPAGSEANDLLTSERDLSRRAGAERVAQLGPSAAGRSLFIVNSVGLALDDPARPFTILVYADGPARVAVGLGPLAELKDTLRLHTLPAMILDATDADIHVRLVDPGRIRIAGPVTRGASYLCAAGAHIVVKRGATGISNPDRGSLGPHSRDADCW